MKRPTMLFQALLTQVKMELGVSTERDFQEIESRFEHEGLSFLTITLPHLSDALESGIEMGRFTLPNGFRKDRRNGTLPALLRGLFNRVFDEGGSLRSEACAESIYWIRQITRFFKKPKLSCSPKRELEAIAKFKNVEEDLYHATTQVKRHDPVLDLVSCVLWNSVFHTLDPSHIVCGHGPGVTADRLLSNERRRIRYWYTRAEGTLSAADHAFHNWNAACGEEGVGGLRDIDYRDLRSEPAVRVVFVPKTLQSPRVIAIEPASMQFMQQGVARHMMAVLERHRLTAGSVNFTDQTINQKLAYSASIDRRLATIDLSDASDRVHLELVQRIFRKSALLELLEDCRSLHADLPDGSNVLLKKYASMGSALCFPVEACVFYTLVLSAIMQTSGMTPNYRSITALKKVVKVYGDDIIVPVEYVDAVSDYLESYGLRVNRRKSFSRSAFRESCGADFYNGYSVKPIYARMDMPARRSEWTPEHVMSWVSTANQFYEAGLWIVAQAIRDQLSTIVVTQIPISRHYDEGICFASLIQDRNLRWNAHLQSYDQRRICYTPLKRKDKTDEHYGCFNQWFESKRTVSPSGLFEPEGGNSIRDQNMEPESNLFDSPLRRTYRKSSSSQLRLYEAHPTWECSPYARSRVDTEHDFALRGAFVGRSLHRPRPSRESPLGTSSFLVRSTADSNVGLDFHQTVKRGVFKPKPRWVTIVS